MLTYTTLAGHVLDLSDLSDQERAHFDRCYSAYRDGIAWHVFQELVVGGENPLLAATGGWVTPPIWDHPLYQAIRDLGDRLGIRQGEIAAQPDDDIDADPIADEWLPVAVAAARKGVTVPGLHMAIRRGALIARPASEGGRRLVVSARSLAGWTPNAVRQAARKRTPVPAQPAATVPSAEGRVRRRLGVLGAR